MFSRWSAMLFTVFFLTFSANGVTGVREQFQEHLTIRPLRDGKVASTFSFNTFLQDTPRNPESLNNDDYSQHYSVFPLALGQILREYAITELHLTLNAGNWNYDSWGYPDEPGVGTGAELWAWMGDGAPESIDHRWQGLRNALSGLFCASLASLDEQRTTSPILAFTPEGHLPNWTLPHQLRHASLPSEHVCTENLTPFLKLLPCKSLSGIATLLNPHRLFDADWHGMGVHVLWHPEQGVEVRLTFQAVMDPVRQSPMHKRDFSFKSLFDRTIDRPCPITQISRISVALPNKNTYRLRPDPTDIDEAHAIFDVAEGPLEVSMDWPEEQIFNYPWHAAEPSLVPLSVQRTLRGSTQDRGQLSIVLTNNLVSPLRVVYLETMPWLLQFYLHTLRIRSEGFERDDLISNMSYTLPVLHSRPTSFESILSLPPQSSIYLTIEVTKSFLRYTEHPPDAQRGWDLPPAVFVPLNEASKHNSSAESRDRYQRVYTPVLLADLATPDFSMPYNVIILSCSLMAFIFGSIFNLLTRKFVLVRLEDGRKDVGKKS